MGLTEQQLARKMAWLEKQMEEGSRPASRVTSAGAVFGGRNPFEQHGDGEQHHRTWSQSANAAQFTVTPAAPVMFTTRLLPLAAQAASHAAFVSSMGFPYVAFPVCWEVTTAPAPSRRAVQSSM